MLWLHVDPVPDAGDFALIGSEEARHALGARRLAPGDEVTLFDGRGGVATARLSGERGRGGEMRVDVTERRDAAPLQPEVTIAFAVPKGDRLSTLLELATQAGASRLVPIACARSVVDAEKPGRGARWTRIVAESAKVAKSAWMPELLPGGALLEVARAEAARGAALAVAHVGSSEPILRWSRERAPDAARTVFIGPEGGFDEREIAALLSLGAAAVSLGPLVMRVELAAVAATLFLRGTAD